VNKKTTSGKPPRQTVRRRSRTATTAAGGKGREGKTTGRRRTPERRSPRPEKGAVRGGAERAGRGGKPSGSTWRKPASGRPRPERIAREDALERVARSSVGPGGYLHASDIPAHRLGRQLRKALYQVANSLDDSESQNLAARLKYAATTVTAALAAGFGEGSFRAGIARSLECRGALYAIQDHLEQLLDVELLAAEQRQELSRQVDEVIKAVNEYLGVLVRERQRIDMQS